MLTIPQEDIFNMTLFSSTGDVSEGAGPVSVRRGAARLATLPRV